MLDSQVALLENAIARYVATGEVPGRLGSRHPSIAPFAAFATRDGHIAIAAGNDDLFARVAKVLGREDLVATPASRAIRKRVQNHEPLHEEMEIALSGQTVEGLARTCSTRQACPRARSTMWRR